MTKATCNNGDGRPVKALGLCIACYQNDRIQRIRSDWIEQQGGKCTECGSTEQLEVDHLDPETKLYNTGALWSISPTNPNRIAELAKCHLLCKSCHRKKTSAELYSKRGPHGQSPTWYKHGCRCDLCKKLKARHNAKRKLSS